MARSTLSTITKLLVLVLLLAGPAFGQTTTIRDGSSPGVADVMGSAPTGTEQGLVSRPIFPTAATSAAVSVRCVNTAGNAFESCGGGGGGGGGASIVDNDTFTAGTTATSPISGVYNDGLADVTSGNAAAVRITPDRGLHINIRNVTGTEMGTASNPLRFDPTGTTGQPVTNAGTFAVQAAQSGTWTVQPGNTANTTPWLTTISQGGNAAAVNASGQLSITCANCSGSGASHVDDAAFTPATNSGAPAMGFFDDVAPDSVNEGDAGVVRMSANRNLYVTIRDAAGNERGLNIDSSGQLAVTGTFWQATQPVSLASVPSHAVTNAGTFAVQPGGSVAHDGAASAVNPVLLGGYASAAAPADVSNDTDAVRAWYLRNGAQASQPTFAGVLATTGNGASGTGVQRVTIANDSTGTIITTQATAANLNMRPDMSGATGAAPPARAAFIGGLGSGATGGLLTGITVGDTFANINVSTATTTLLVTGVSGRHVRITSLDLVSAAANNVALISGTGATCGTGTSAMNGGTSAAAGWNLAANTGLVKGTGIGEVNRTNATGDSVCIVTSAATQLSGRIGYAIY